MSGTVTATNVPLPTGAATPTGKVIALTIDASTNQVVDFDLEDSAPNVEAMGVPETLGG
jgi:hypothetical protein